MQKAISENCTKAISQNDYEKAYKELSEKYATVKERYDEILESIQNMESKTTIFKSFTRKMEKVDTLLEEFDEELFCNLVQGVVVKTNDKITIIFKNGMKIEL